MGTEPMDVNWAELKMVLVAADNTKDLLTRIASKEQLTNNDMALLTLLMQEYAHKWANEIAEKSAYDTYTLGHGTLGVVKETSKFTRSLKNATYWLAAATIILALSAVADICLRIFCSK